MVEHVELRVEVPQDAKKKVKLVYVETAGEAPSGRLEIEIVE